MAGEAEAAVRDGGISESAVAEADQDDRYSMILEWEPRGGVYVVTVPELPGCRTHGSTREEAVRHGREVIELWIEDAREAGDSIPPPRHFDLDSIDVTHQTRVMLTGDDDDDAQPYHERTSH